MFFIYTNTGIPTQLTDDAETTTYQLGDVELIIVETGIFGEVTVDQFDERYMSPSLKLHMSDETDITNLDGKPLQWADIPHKTVAVFYTRTTRSIPPQATPSKVIVLD